MLFVFLDIKAAHHNINQTKEQRRIVHIFICVIDSIFKLTLSTSSLMIAICRASLRFMNFTSWTPENISSVFAWRILSFWDLLWLKLWENRSVFFFFELLWFVPTASDNILKPTDTTAQRLTIRLMSQNFSAVATQEKKIRNLFLWFFFVSVIFSNDLIRADQTFSSTAAVYFHITDVRFLNLQFTSNFIRRRPTLRLFFLFFFGRRGYWYERLSSTITDMRLSCIKQSRPTRRVI